MIGFLAFLGFIFGIMSALLGIGGGVFFIPVFSFLFPHMTQQEIIPQSLFFIFLTCTYASIRFFKIPQVRKDFRLPMILTICVGIFLGSQGGRLGMQYISSHKVKIIFAYVLLLLAFWSVIQIIFWKHFQKKIIQPPSEFLPPKILPSFILGLCAGIVSSLTGLGGGIILMPVFTLLWNYPLMRASFFSNLCIACSGFSNTLINLSNNTTLLYTDIFLVFSGCLIGVPVGIRLTDRLSKKFILWIQSILYLILAIKSFL